MNTLDTIMTRRSYRGKYKNQPVPREDLQKILEAGLADLSTGMSLEARERIDFAILHRVTNRVVPRGVGVIDLLVILVAAVAVAAADQIDRVFRAGNDVRVAEAGFNRP